MTTQNILDALQKQELIFNDVLAHIENLYEAQPTAFTNGSLKNEGTQNQGSARVLFFAKKEGLSANDTLCLFAEHYQAVLNDPDGEAHQNIRQFMQHGWDGVTFEKDVLIEK
ncbi:HopJ type III effector protein [Flavobacterium agricola]|uniref:HopJ type III effector protein n=1 Tax=Flavobacterium agricola TaxID=2870839 RepID=A0ABY6LXB4_9FLAO|nr:HopJ type III effector protein [Flavobacterium agricola]UYW00811.1 HopJ type III effector protein [Flavobacterium agricola]